MPTRVVRSGAALAVCDNGIANRAPGRYGRRYGAGMEDEELRSLSPGRIAIDSAGITHDGVPLMPGRYMVSDSVLTVGPSLLDDVAGDPADDEI